MDDKQQFLHSLSPYYGRPGTDAARVNQHLQDFAQRVGYICNLHTGGRLSSQAAFEQLERLWDAVAIALERLDGPDSDDSQAV